MNFCSKCFYSGKDVSQEPCCRCVRSCDSRPTEYLPKKQRKKKPVKIADKIRRMDDEELAALFKHVCTEENSKRTVDEWLEWLKIVLTWEVEKK